MNRVSFGEWVIDNLTFWAFVAVVIGLLYAVWATIEILNHYVVTVAPYIPGSPIAIGR